MAQMIHHNINNIHIKRIIHTKYHVILMNQSRIKQEVQMIHGLIVTYILRESIWLNNMVEK